MSSTSSHWMPNSYGFYRKAERNDINTEQLVFASLKKKKEKKAVKKKNYSTPGIDRGTLERQRFAVPLGYANIKCRTRGKINILISINYKTSDNSADLYEDFLLVNFLVL